MHKKYITQQTLKRDVSLSGNGLHTNEIVNMTLRPAAKDTGIVFVRNDMPGGENVIPALYDRVDETNLCTQISNGGGAKVATIEHLMSALRGLGIDNALVEIDAPEVPAMDGSAREFVKMIRKAGIKSQQSPRRMIRVLRQVQVRDGDKCATLTPEEACVFEGSIDFAHPEIGKQHLETYLVNGNYLHDIADARTFGFLKEHEQLKKLGLGKGASMDNVIVLGDDRVLNESGLRHENEFIRHKILDAIGDLNLAGGHILGRYTGIKPGHAINNALLHELFSSDKNYEITTIGAKPKQLVEA